jgi:hypothetical protein
MCRIRGLTETASRGIGMVAQHFLDEILGPVLFEFVATSLDY